MVNDTQATHANDATPAQEQRERQEVKHTPGPWRVHPHSDGTFGICAANGKCPAMAWDYPEVEGRANADLIAASPDLLAALLEVSRWQMPDGPCWCDNYEKKKGANKHHFKACAAARAAIAKATGGQS